MAGNVQANTPSSCDLQVSVYLAQCLVDSGQWAAALDHYRFAGQAFLAKGEPHNALSVYTLASRLIPHCLSTHGVIAGLLHKLGRSGEALARLDQLAGAYVSQQRYAEALSLYRLAVEIDPEGAHRRVCVADLAYWAGDYDGALHELRTACRLFVDAGQCVEVVTVAQRIFSLQPGHIDTLADVAEALLQSRKLHAAVTRLRELMARSPRNDRGRELLAQCYALHGRFDVASRLYRLLGGEFAMKGVSHFDDAKRLLQAAIQCNPGDLIAQRSLRMLEQEIAEAARRDFCDEAPTGLLIEELSSEELLLLPPPDDDVTNVVQLRHLAAPNAVATANSNPGEIIFAAFG